MAVTDDIRTVTLTKQDIITAITNYLLSLNNVPGDPLTIVLNMNNLDFQAASPTDIVVTTSWDITAES